MTRPRLPLRGISVFEAVARLGSFKAAADELHLTPSAVSHQIRALESQLGVGLFSRESKGVRLTPAAAEYADRLHGLLHPHADRYGRDRRTRPPGPGDRNRPHHDAALACDPLLMPRLPAFIDAHPGIDVRVAAVRTADGNADDFDITIGYGDPARSRGHARPLLEEVYRPYCSPSRLSGAALLDARQLLDQPLIGSRENDVSWEEWFTRRGIEYEPWALKHLQIDPRTSPSRRR